MENDQTFKKHKILDFMDNPHNAFTGKIVNKIFKYLYPAENENKAHDYFKTYKLDSLLAMVFISRWEDLNMLATHQKYVACININDNNKIILCKHIGGGIKKMEILINNLLGKNDK